MTKSKSSPGGLPDIMTNPFAGADAGASVQAFWAAQGAMIEHMRGFLDGWYGRRRDAAAAAADCCASMVEGGGDVTAATRAVSALASGSLERLRDDLSAQTALATSIAAEMAEAWSANGATPHRRRKAHHEPTPESNGTARVRPAADVR